MRGVLAFGGLAFLRLSVLRVLGLTLGDKDEAFGSLSEWSSRHNQVRCVEDVLGPVQGDPVG